MIVAIEAGISGGKTTLCKALDGVKFYEPLQDDNPFLEKFYADPKRWATQMQIHTLTIRYRQWMEAQARSMNSGAVCIMDRTIFLDAAFAKINHDSGNISDDEFNSYMLLHETMQANIYFPDLIIYLKATPELCLQRIAERGRECEAGVPIEYLRALEKAYDEVMDTLRHKCPVVEIDASLSKEEVLARANVAIGVRRAALNERWPRWKGGF